jgi:MtaA/CmuA family methyltransferase
MNSYERTMAKLKGEEVDRLPVHPLFMIYAADLIGVKYSEYLRDYRLLVKGQLAVVEKYGVDLVSCCSDAWREAADCGADLVWYDNQPPHCMEPLIKNAESLAELKIPDPSGGGRMTDRIESVRLFSSSVKGEIPILGWVEGPISEATDLYGMNEFMMGIMIDPEFMSNLMDWTTELAIRFAIAQINAGADIVGIGDAAASLVSPDFYEMEIMPREKKIVEAIHDAGASARLHICGLIKGKFKAMDSTGADLIDIDYPQEIAEVRDQIRPETCLSGNLNPVSDFMRSSPGRIFADFKKCHKEAGNSYFVAPGCEIPQGTPDINIQAMMDYANSTA